MKLKRLSQDLVNSLKMFVLFGLKVTFSKQTVATCWLNDDFSRALIGSTKKTEEHCIKVEQVGLIDN